jgi:glycosyltransferase involved in cell wall biosynthesis
MKIVFVNYGEFGNNSSNHIDGFARRLANRGHEIGIVADGCPASKIPTVGYASYDGVNFDDGEDRIASMLQDASTLLHVWTPRERARRWVEPLAKAGLRYVVHLEDDEDVVTRTQLRWSDTELSTLSAAELDELVPLHLSHPKRSRAFLSGAAGVTVIVDALRAKVPEGVPQLLLEPGADLSLFGPDPDRSERSRRRQSLGLGPSTTVLLFHGGIHPAIQRDMFALYTAVAKLRRIGQDVVLLRLGTSSYAPEVSTAFRRADGVIQVSSVPRWELANWLDLADIYVQPGAANVFNARRLPSKLLDFFAMGRPVILPGTNLGRRCRDGHDAIVLRQGGAEEIIRSVLRLMSDPDLMEQLGRNGRALAERDFDWDDKVEVLEKFYAQLGGGMEMASSS